MARRLQLPAFLFLTGAAVAAVTLRLFACVGYRYALDSGPFWLRAAQVTFEDGAVTWFPSWGNQLAFEWWRLLVAALLGMALIGRPAIVRGLASPGGIGALVFVTNVMVCSGTTVFVGFGLSAILIFDLAMMLGVAAASLRPRATINSPNNPF